MCEQVAGPGWNTAGADEEEEWVLLLREVDFELFIDRNPLPYIHILDYLRTGRIYGEIRCVAELKMEAEYLGLGELQRLADDLPEMSR